MNNAIEHHQGQPCVRLQLPGGDHALITLFGAQVIGWQTADGHEHFYLSPRAVYDGNAAIRGGVPVCFPQFNQRVLDGRTLPKHGFARTARWHPQPAAPEGDGMRVRLSLSEADLPAALSTAWPHRFEAFVDVTLAPDRLRIAFSIRNTDAAAWPFALALHSYFRVDDIGRTGLHGLRGADYWDAVRDPKDLTVKREQTEEPLRFAGETDRVYRAAPGALELPRTRGRLLISQSADLTETVVWNPGADLCATLNDMPPDGYRQMLCVEAAVIDTPVRLAPGAQWQGWQQLGWNPAV